MSTTLIKKSQLLLEDFLQRSASVDWTSDDLGASAAAIKALASGGKTYFGWCSYDSTSDIQNISLTDSTFVFNSDTEGLFCLIFDHDVPAGGELYWLDPSDYNYCHYPVKHLGSAVGSDIIKAGDTCLFQFYASEFYLLSIDRCGSMAGTSGVAKHLYLNTKVIGTRLQGNIYVDGAASDTGMDNGETIPCYFGYDVNAGDTISIYDTNSAALVTDASVYYLNAAITTGVIKAGDWAFLIYNSTSNLFMVIATSVPRYTKTVNGESVVGSGNIAIETWTVHTATDGEVSYNIPDTGHAHAIVDNSSNTSDLIVSYSSGSGYIVINELGGSTVVSAGGKAHFEYRRFTDNGNTYVWVKRSSITNIT